MRRQTEETFCLLVRRVGPVSSASAAAGKIGEVVRFGDDSSGLTQY